MHITPSYVVIAIAFLAIVWRGFHTGWRVRPAENPWLASGLLVASLVTLTKLSLHLPDVRTQLNIIIGFMVLTPAIQLFHAIRDSRLNHDAPLWSKYAATCTVASIVSFTVIAILHR